MPQSAAARVATAARRLRCVELAGAGKTYAEIAAEVGYAGKSSARKAVVAALAAREADAVDDLRRLEVARLDQLQAASWEDALAGDVRAVDWILRIITLRAKLLGLFDGASSSATGSATSLVTGEYTALDVNSPTRRHREDNGQVRAGSSKTMASTDAIRGPR